MKANTPIQMKNGTVKSGEFRYVRTPRTLKAYDKEFAIPVRTVEFEEKLEQAGKVLSECRTASETAQALREGVSLFIGEEETERIFPKEKLMEIDVDELLGFWQALNFELKLAQEEQLSKYRPASNIRR